MDATAPLEDAEEEDNGPVDSDEETAAVMSALSNWRPQPVVPQPVFQPIRRQYNLARLQEQLHMATNGGRTNIFAVSGFGAQRIPEFLPPPPPVPQQQQQKQQHQQAIFTPMDTEDAPGEMDFSIMGMGGDAGGAPNVSRQASVASKA